MREGFDKTDDAEASPEESLEDIREEFREKYGEDDGHEEPSTGGPHETRPESEAPEASRREMEERGEVVEGQEGNDERTKLGSNQEEVERSEADSDDPSKRLEEFREEMRERYEPGEGDEADSGQRSEDVSRYDEASPDAQEEAKESQGGPGGSGSKEETAASDAEEASNLMEEQISAHDEPEVSGAREPTNPDSAESAENVQDYDDDLEPKDLEEFRERVIEENGPEGLGEDTPEGELYDLARDEMEGKGSARFGGADVGDGAEDGVVRDVASDEGAACADSGATDRSGQDASDSPPSAEVDGSRKVEGEGDAPKEEIRQRDVSETEVEERAQDDLESRKRIVEERGQEEFGGDTPLDRIDGPKAEAESVDSPREGSAEEVRQGAATSDNTDMRTIAETAVDIKAMGGEPAEIRSEAGAENSATPPTKPDESSAVADRLEEAKAEAGRNEPREPEHTETRPSGPESDNSVVPQRPMESGPTSDLRGETSELADLPELRGDANVAAAHGLGKPLDVETLTQAQDETKEHTVEDGEMGQLQPHSPGPSSKLGDLGGNPRTRNDTLDQVSSQPHLGENVVPRSDVSVVYEGGWETRESPREPVDRSLAPNADPVGVGAPLKTGDGGAYPLESSKSPTMGMDSPVSPDDSSRQTVVGGTTIRQDSEKLGSVESVREVATAQDYGRNRLLAVVDEARAEQLAGPSTEQSIERTSKESAPESGKATPLQFDTVAKPDNLSPTPRTSEHGIDDFMRHFESHKPRNLENVSLHNEGGELRMEVDNVKFALRDARFVVSASKHELSGKVESTEKEVLFQFDGEKVVPRLGSFKIKQMDASDHGLSVRYQSEGHEHTFTYRTVRYEDGKPVFEATVGRRTDGRFTFVIPRDDFLRASSKKFEVGKEYEIQGRMAGKNPFGATHFESERSAKTGEIHFVTGKGQEGLARGEKCEVTIDSVNERQHFRVLGGKRPRVYIGERSSRSLGFPDASVSSPDNIVEFRARNLSGPNKDSTRCFATVQPVRRLELTVTRLQAKANDTIQITEVKPYQGDFVRDFAEHKPKNLENVRLGRDESGLSMFVDGKKIPLQQSRLSTDNLRVTLTARLGDTKSKVQFCFDGRTISSKVGGTSVREMSASDSKLTISPFDRAGKSSFRHWKSQEGTVSQSTVEWGSEEVKRPMTAQERAAWEDAEGNYAKKGYTVTVTQKAIEPLIDYCEGARRDGVSCRIAKREPRRTEKTPNPSPFYEAIIGGAENVAKEIASTERWHRHPGRIKQMEEMKERLRTTKSRKDTILHARDILSFEA